MLYGLNAKKNHCFVSNIENLVANIRSVKFSFLLSINPVNRIKKNIGESRKCIKIHSNLSSVNFVKSLW